MRFFQKKHLFVASMLTCTVALQANFLPNWDGISLDSVPFCVKITNPANQPVEQLSTKVSINGGNFLANTTNLLGQACFTAPDQTEVTVTLVPNQDIKNGVNVYDIYLMYKHILGIKQIAEPSSIIAADVNFSNTVTTFDMIKIRDVILGQRNDFANTPNAPIWLFFEKSFFNGQIPPTNINQVSETEFSIVPPVSDLELVVVKKGDVNHSAVVNSTMPEEPIIGNTCINFDDQVLAEGQEVIVQFTFDNFIRAVQGGLLFNQLEILSVTSPVGTNLEQFGIFQINADQTLLTFARLMVTNPTTMDFSLLVRAKTALSVHNSISLDETITPLMAFDDDGNRFDFCLNGPSGTDNPLAGLTFSVSPNPWNEQLNITFEQPSPTALTVEIYDALGRRITQVEAAAGASNITLTADDVHDATGLLFYKISGSNWSQTGKIFRAVR